MSILKLANTHGGHVFKKKYIVNHCCQEIQKSPTFYKKNFKVYYYPPVRALNNIVSSTIYLSKCNFQNRPPSSTSIASSTPCTLQTSPVKILPIPQDHMKHHFHQESFPSPNPKIAPSSEFTPLLQHGHSTISQSYVKTFPTLLNYKF